MKQVHDILKVMVDMYSLEGSEYKGRANASIQALRTYYQTPQTHNFNLDEALHALITLIERQSQAIKPEQQNKFMELSKKPWLSSYTGIPDNLVPPEIRAARHQPYGRPSGQEHLKVYSGRTEPEPSQNHGINHLYKKQIKVPRGN